MADIWFTSDTHFGHQNIIEFCKRPFHSAHEMDMELRSKWNMVVRPSDHIYHLGDVTMDRGSKGGKQAQAFIEWIKTLNGHKRLIMGNHDHFPAEVYLAAGFEKVMAMNMLEGIRLTHIPLHPRSMGGAVANVHGHIHEQDDFEPVLQVMEKTQEVLTKPYINICVERTAYRPIPFEEVRQRIRDAGGKI